MMKSVSKVWPSLPAHTSRSMSGLLSVNKAIPLLHQYHWRSSRTFDSSSSSSNVTDTCSVPFFPSASPPTSPPSPSLLRRSYHSSASLQHTPESRHTRATGKIAKHFLIHAPPGQEELLLRRLEREKKTHRHKQHVQNSQKNRKRFSNNDLHAYKRANGIRFPDPFSEDSGEEQHVVCDMDKYAGDDGGFVQADRDKDDETRINVKAIMKALRPPRYHHPTFDQDNRALNLFLYRQLLKQARLLFDDVARWYAISRVQDRFRWRMDCKKHFLITELQEEAVLHIELLRRANNGDKKSLETILRQAYGFEGWMREEVRSLRVDALYRPDRLNTDRLQQLHPLLYISIFKDSHAFKEAIYRRIYKMPRHRRRAYVCLLGEMPVVPDELNSVFCSYDPLSLVEDLGLDLHPSSSTSPTPVPTLASLSAPSPVVAAPQPSSSFSSSSPPKARALRNKNARRGRSKK